MIRDKVEYLVKDGERLDQIIYSHYDIEPAELNSALAFIYQSNPNLAAIKQPFKSVLNDVLYITLPPLPEVSKKERHNLWS